MKKSGVFLLCFLSLIFQFICSRGFQWEYWNSQLTVQPNGDIHVVEQHAVNFYDGRFSEMYRSLPVGHRGKNDGLNISSVFVSGIVETNGTERKVPFQRIFSQKKILLSDGNSKNKFYVEKHPGEYFVVIFFPETEKKILTFEVEFQLYRGLFINIEEKNKYKLDWKIIPEDHKGVILSSSCTIKLPKNTQVLTAVGSKNTPHTKPSNFGPNNVIVEMSPVYTLSKNEIFWAHVEFVNDIIKDHYSFNNWQVDLQYTKKYSILLSYMTTTWLVLVLLISETTVFIIFLIVCISFSRCNNPVETKYMLSSNRRKRRRRREFPGEDLEVEEEFFKNRDGGKTLNIFETEDQHDYTNNISILEQGYMYYGYALNHFIVAQLIDLCVRGFIQIVKKKDCIEIRKHSEILTPSRVFQDYQSKQKKKKKKMKKKTKKDEDEGEGEIEEELGGGGESQRDFPERDIDYAFLNRLFLVPGNDKVVLYTPEKKEAPKLESNNNKNNNNNNIRIRKKNNNKLKVDRGERDMMLEAVNDVKFIQHLEEEGAIRERKSLFYLIIFSSCFVCTLFFSIPTVVITGIIVSMNDYVEFSISFVSVYLLQMGFYFVVVFLVLLIVETWFVNALVMKRKGYRVVKHVRFVRKFIRNVVFSFRMKALEKKFVREETIEVLNEVIPPKHHPPPRDKTEITIVTTEEEEFETEKSEEEEDSNNFGVIERDEVKDIRELSTLHLLPINEKYLPYSILFEEEDVFCKILWKNSKFDRIGKTVFHRPWFVEIVDSKTDTFSVQRSTVSFLDCLVRIGESKMIALNMNHGELENQRPVLEEEEFVGGKSEALLSRPDDF